MNYPVKLYDRLPHYSRSSDIYSILELLCDRAIQPELDRIYEIIANREVLYDPYDSDSDLILDFLGQFFGLQSGEDRWLGIGLNPNWDSEQKRRVILAISNYWRIKGTEAGVLKALELWLQWDNPQVEFTYPYRDLRNWFTYGEPFQQSSASPLNRKQLGSGDYFPGTTYRPQWQVIEDVTLQVVSQAREYSRSRLGGNNAWLQLYPTEANWNEISRNIERLNPEIWDARTIITNICWLTLETDSLSEGDNWLIIATKNYSYVLRPYWDRGNLTFLFRNRYDGETITNIELILNQIKTFNYVPATELLLTENLVYGVRVKKKITGGVRAIVPQGTDFKYLKSTGEISYDLAKSPNYDGTTITYDVDNTNFISVLPEGITYPYFPNHFFACQIPTTNIFVYHTGDKIITNNLGIVTVVDEAEEGQGTLIANYQNLLLILRDRLGVFAVDIYEYSNGNLTLQTSRPLPTDFDFVPRCGAIHGNLLKIAGSCQIDGEDVCAWTTLDISCLISGSTVGSCDLSANLEFLAVNNLAELANEGSNPQKDGYRRGTIIGMGYYGAETYYLTHYSQQTRAFPIWRVARQTSFLIRESDRAYLGRFATPAYTPSPMVEFDSKLCFFSRDVVLYFDGTAIRNASQQWGLPQATDFRQFTALAVTGTKLALGLDNEAAPFIYS